MNGQVQRVLRHVIRDLRDKPLEYGVLGWSYVALASFAVVYLGEHYLIDVLIGLAVAEAVRRAEPVASPFALQLARVLQCIAGTGVQRP